MGEKRTAQILDRTPDGAYVVAHQGADGAPAIATLTPARPGEAVLTDMATLSRRGDSGLYDLELLDVPGRACVAEGPGEGHERGVPRGVGGDLRCEPGGGSVKTLAFPRCAVCGRDVEEIREEHDTFMRRVRFTAKCHGSVQVVDIPFADFERADQGPSFGEAFTDEARRLPGKSDAV